MAEAFHWPARVYWEDTDAGGVVYHARYLAFMERARSEWMRALGWDQGVLRDRDDQVFVVRAMDIDFRAPARLDDQLQVSVRLLECRGASFSVGQRIERDGNLLVEARVRIAAVRASDFRPRPIPAALLTELKPLLETP
ncbi:tol-pal system-associated acyl-CoA thioesterase [Thermomonas carbonis]|uniref:Tol-pal system-associated acyl-CoA thioesterase n=1 Tax=Thermomonas carbonis TaxID=1463158 RepID=A0A7G9SLM8_9GAMM|nr:tol-pal system-associated acyl-CoA thioesterase [Thermomonas carbonis]QNN68753.1 tol-pal system-associated acyl-CoA thioesterase [Thermomonas carbonis]GHC09029.1 tol-pal system-associated acyl-CoA thioesterase [Thermomonas carbonis]